MGLPLWRYKKEEGIGTVTEERKVNRVPGAEKQL